MYSQLTVNWLIRVFGFWLDGASFTLVTFEVLQKSSIVRIRFYGSTFGIFFPSNSFLWQFLERGKFDNRRKFGALRIDEYIIVKLFAEHENVLLINKIYVSTGTSVLPQSHVCLHEVQVIMFGQWRNLLQKLFFCH